MNFFLPIVAVAVVTVLILAAFPPPRRDEGRYDVYSISCKDGREWKGVEVSFSGGGFYVSRKNVLIAIIKSDCVAEKN